MELIEIPRSKELKWPDRCAYCNAPKHAFSELKHSTISGINPFFYTRKFLTLRFPVCQRHRLSARFHGFLSHQSFVDLFIGFLFIPLLLALPALALPLSGMQTNVLVVLLYAAYPIVVIVLRTRMPIRVLRYDQDTIQLGLSNAEFARTFRLLND